MSGVGLTLGATGLLVGAFFANSWQCRGARKERSASGRALMPRGQAETAGPTPDHRRAIAERNVEAILDAAERMLARHSRVGISAVAAEAGFSRVTVYAHFPALEDLLEGWSSGRSGMRARHSMPPSRTRGRPSSAGEAGRRLLA